MGTWTGGWMDREMDKWMNECYSWIGVSWHININIKDHYMLIPKYHSTLGDLWQIPIYKARCQFWDIFPFTFYISDMGRQLPIPVGQAEVGTWLPWCAHEPKVAGWYQWFGRNLWREWRMVLKKYDITNNPDTTEDNSIWKIRISSALSWKVFRRDSIWM